MTEYDRNGCGFAGGERLAETPVNEKSESEIGEKDVRTG